MTEMVVQQLLVDAGAKDVDQDLVDVDPQGLEVAADWRTLRSPETYVGYGQATGFASADVAAFDQPPRLRGGRAAPAELLGPHGRPGRSPGTPGSWTSPAGASRSSSRPATSTS